MADQEVVRDSHQRSSIGGFTNHRLSDLLLDVTSTASSTGDNLAFVHSDPFPSYSALNRRSPSSTNNPMQIPAELHRLISEGYKPLHFSTGASGLKDSQRPRPCFSMKCAPFCIPPSLSASGSAPSFPPPLPPGRTRTTRTSSDPVLLNPVTKPVLDSPAAATSLASTGLNHSIFPNSRYHSTPDSPPPNPKRLKTVDSATKIRNQMDRAIAPEIETEITAEKTATPIEAPSQEDLVEKNMAKEEGLEAEADPVIARKVGESTLLDFKCKCGSGFGLRLFGNSCYYRLA